MAYQGPNVQVTQKFVTTPGAVAVENLPPAGIGTAYDVYSKENLGVAYGIIAREALFGVDKVIHDESVIGERLYSFYPVKAYANTTLLGIVPITATISATGINITKTASYTVTDMERTALNCTATVPYYYKNLGTDKVKVLITDTTKVIATGAAFTSAKLKAGQNVLIGNESTASSFVCVGQVAYTTETTIVLNNPVGNLTELSFDTVVVGADKYDVNGVAIVYGVSGTIINKDKPNCLYDETIDFSTRVRGGDIIEFTGAAFTGTVKASITSFSANMITYNTQVVDHPTTSFARHEAAWNGGPVQPVVSISVSTYAIKRLIGFSESKGYQWYDNTGSTTGVKIVADAIDAVAVKTGANSFKILKAVSAQLALGDYISITSGTTSTDETTATIFYKINTADSDSTHYLYSTEEAIMRTGSTAFAIDDYINAWHPVIESDILADFRAVRTSELGVLKRIESLENIETAWGAISPYNELAYAMAIAYTSSGNSVCYGIHVDSTSATLAAEYSAALEELVIPDVYSHFFCTTNAGVNALMPTYVDSQSAPYEAHERTGIICYDEWDVYRQGIDTGTRATTGLITLSGAINLPNIGVSVGDSVDVYNSSGVLLDTVNVTATPTSTEPNKCQTDGVLNTGTTFEFNSGRKADQATRISNLGLGNRRVTVLWPGWFQGDVGTTPTTTELPPYYIAAAIAGLDCISNPSKSFTNGDFSLFGISNIVLNTNSYFRKTQLDTIGGGGIDIMIQDGNTSQTIKSRHDLTSNMDAIEYRERSITKQADVAAKTIRSAVQPYVGKYNITESLLMFLKQVCAIVSSKLTKDGIVESLDIQSIERDANIADKINFNVTCTVFVAGNYYDIQMLVVSR